MKKRIILFAVLLFASYLSSAQSLFRDDFSAYNIAQLSGQGTWTNNSSSSGLGSCIPPGSCSNSGIVANAISYLNYGSSTKSLSVIPNTDGVGTFFPAVSSGDIYVAFVLNLSAAQANNNSDFFRVSSGNNLNTSFRLYATPAGAGSFFLGTSKGSNGNAISFSASSFNTNQDHLVVIKYAQLPGNNDDVLSVYVDPVFANGVPAVPTMTTTVGADQSGSLDRLFFRQNWSNGMPTGRAGLVSVARTWQDLSFLSLSAGNFENYLFSVISSDIKNGILSIESNIELDKAFLKIFDVQGKNLISKNISLRQELNIFYIDPIQNQGVYIIEITSGDKKFVQKFIIK
ncbi:MAG TPA: T9SS type A sorting domain-containing protein [Flavobacterium sp.]|nr:T9SS type A sorting domain-containing protein [Flavobacterium sp.]